MGYVETFLVSLSFLLFFITLPFSLCVCFKIVSEYERVVIFRLGKLRLGEARGPGLFFVLPCVDKFIKVDLRITHFDIPPQEGITKDSKSIWADAVVYYKVVKPVSAVAGLVNYSTSASLLAMAILRNVLGTNNLSELLADRDKISQRMTATLDRATDPWGVKVERVEITYVRLPEQMEKAVASEALATGKAKAAIAPVEGEVKAPGVLKQATDAVAYLLGVPLKSGPEA